MSKQLTKTKAGKEFVNTIMYGLQAPIIVPPSMVSAVTKKQRDEHRMYTLLHAAECVDKKECTDYDAILYYSYASLENPPGRDNAECYMYLFFKYRKDAAEILDRECPELDENQLQSIKRLKQWIYKKQLEGMKK